MNGFHRLGYGLLPPPRAVPLPRRGRSWGIRRSRPAALPSIGYRGFAVAPITLRASFRSLLYNSGCRVATLLVSKGVMGFLGDLRGRNSKSPPNPLGLAERVYSFHRLRAVPLPRRGRSGGFAGQGLRPCRRLNIGALRSPLSPFARPLEGLLEHRR